VKRPLPIIGAPMAGGISTPELVAAVSDAGGLGFLPAGYLTAERVRDDIQKLRAITDAPFGLNIFMGGPDSADAAAIDRYAQTLRGEAQRLGVELGQPRFDDDHYADKLAVALQERPAVVSFTFGCPSEQEINELRAAAIEVCVTVTSPEEAEIAAAAGADSLVLQGTEAGGHRGYFNDDGSNPEASTMALIASISAQMTLPLIAAGGIMDRDGAQAALAAGAQAVQVGTALMLAPEAGTAAVHRSAFADTGGTRLTRAFTGRTARGIVNRFMDEHEADAVRGYPQIHHVTSPVRAAAKAQGDSSALHLWAGTGYRDARELPAGEIVAALAGRDRADGLERRGGPAVR
jgi:nitronate monooxygenase